MSGWTWVRPCPWCGESPGDHEQRPGYLHWVWLCPKAPPKWRGVFLHRPVRAEQERATG